MMPDEHKHINQKQIGGLQNKGHFSLHSSSPGRSNPSFIPLLWLTWFREGEVILGGNKQHLLQWLDRRKGSEKSIFLKIRFLNLSLYCLYPSSIIGLTDNPSLCLFLSFLSLLHPSLCSRAFFQSMTLWPRRNMTPNYLHFLKTSMTMRIL